MAAIALKKSQHGGNGRASDQSGQAPAHRERSVRSESQSTGAGGRATSSVRKRGEQGTGKGAEDRATSRGGLTQDDKRSASYHGAASGRSQRHGWRTSSTAFRRARVGFGCDEITRVWDEARRAVGEDQFGGYVQVLQRFMHGESSKDELDDAVNACFRPRGVVYHNNIVLALLRSAALSDLVSGRMCEHVVRVKDTMSAQVPPEFLDAAAADRARREEVRLQQERQARQLYGLPGTKAADAELRAAVDASSTALASQLFEKSSSAGKERMARGDGDVAVASADVERRRQRVDSGEVAKYLGVVSNCPLVVDEDAKGERAYFLEQEKRSARRGVYVAGGDASHLAHIAPDAVPPQLKKHMQVLVSEEDIEQYAPGAVRNRGNVSRSVGIGTMTSTSAGPSPDPDAAGRHDSNGTDMPSLRERLLPRAPGAKHGLTGLSKGATGGAAPGGALNAVGIVGGPSGVRSGVDSLTKILLRHVRPVTMSGGLDASLSEKQARAANCCLLHGCVPSAAEIQESLTSMLEEAVDVVGAGGLTVTEGAARVARQGLLELLYNLLQSILAVILHSSKSPSTSMAGRYDYSGNSAKRRWRVSSAKRGGSAPTGSQASSPSTIAGRLPGRRSMATMTRGRTAIAAGGDSSSSRTSGGAGATASVLSPSPVSPVGVVASVAAGGRARSAVSRSVHAGQGKKLVLSKHAVVEAVARLVV